MTVDSRSVVEGSTEGARWKEFLASHPKPAELNDRAYRLVPGGLNHNLRQRRPFRLYIGRGQRPFKWDVDGNRYVDYAMGSASPLLGHDAPHVRAARQEAHGYVPAAAQERELAWAQLVWWRHVRSSAIRGSPTRILRNA
jgi:glutamate-1-semialdehyde aminotransferase